MILAAGRGERMRPLTDDRPKPLLEAGGQPLVEYPLRALAAAGVTTVVINLSWQGGMLREQLGDGSRFGLRIAWLDEGPVALETGGGILNALPLLGPEPFWVVNGDVWCDFAFPPRRLEPGTLGHLLLVPNPAHHPAGDFALREGLIRREGSPRHTYSGIALLAPALFAGREPGRFPLAPLLYAAADRGALKGELHEGAWSDIGTPERLEELRVVLERR
jgi:MurNAc alpha-1-phosphate uridylyltransferase